MNHSPSLGANGGLDLFRSAVGSSRLARQSLGPYWTKGQLRASGPYRNLSLDIFCPRDQLFHSGAPTNLQVARTARRGAPQRGLQFKGQNR